MQPVVWRPNKLAAYTFPRRVRADGLAGPMQVPVRGLAPNCPAFARWLEWPMLCWRDPVQRLPPQVLALDNVDDLVAHATGVGPIWELTQSFGRAGRLRLNAAKFARFARYAAGCRQLRICDGPPVREALLDLGSRHARAPRAGSPAMQ